MYVNELIACWRDAIQLWSDVSAVWTKVFRTKKKNSKLPQIWVMHLKCRTLQLIWKLTERISKWNYWKLFSVCCDTNFALTNCVYCIFRRDVSNVFECGRTVCNKHIIIVIYLPILLQRFNYSVWLLGMLALPWLVLH